MKTKAPVKELQNLEQIYRTFDVLSYAFSDQLGVPLCVPNCGRCCEVVATHCIEAVFVIRTSFREETLDELVDRSERWLLKRHKQAPTYSGLQFDTPEPHVMEQFWALRRSPCPFLLTNKTCLIYNCRPLICRAYGVTHITGPSIDFCPRPLGKGESETYRAWADDTELKKSVEAFLHNLTDPRLKVVALLPTLIFEQVCPEKYKAYMAENKIANAKLVCLPQQYPGLLWQEQMYSKENKTPPHR